jgi:hypothetical protein
MFGLICVYVCHLLHSLLPTALREREREKERERAVTFEFDDVGDLFDAKGVFVLVRESEHADFGRGT